MQVYLPGAAFLLQRPLPYPHFLHSHDHRRIKTLVNLLDIRLRFLVPSDRRVLAMIRAAVGELGSVYGLADEECRAIALAVDEAVANVIRHAYRGASDGAIEMTCRARADQLEFTLLDQGAPPDPARIAGQPLNDSALSGRGTHLIRMIMDEVCYERVPLGNQLRLSKRLPAQKAT